MDEVTFYLEDLKSKFKGIDPNKYYLSYSGGRDSHFLYWFIKNYLHDDKIEIVSINTYMEHPQILKRMKDNADVILYSAMKPFEIKEKFGSPCFTKFQDDMISRYQKGLRSDALMARIYGFSFVGRDGKNYKTQYKINTTAKDLLLSGQLHKISPACCKKLKKDVAREFEKQSGRLPILAVRGAESMMRKSKYSTCFSKNKTFHPLYDLSDGLLRQIEQRYVIEVPEIYQYVSRTGCMGCPYGVRCGDTEKELRMVTKAQRKFLGEYFKESYAVRGIDIESIKRECGDYNA